MLNISSCHTCSRLTHGLASDSGRGQQVTSSWAWATACMVTDFEPCTWIAQVVKGSLHLKYSGLWNSSFHHARPIHFGRREFLHRMANVQFRRRANKTLNGSMAATMLMDGRRQRTCLKSRTLLCFIFWTKKLNYFLICAKGKQTNKNPFRVFSFCPRGIHFKKMLITFEEIRKLIMMFCCSINSMSQAVKLSLTLSNKYFYNKY